jgi:hypothetical protein
MKIVRDVLCVCFCRKNFHGVDSRRDEKKSNEERILFAERHGHQYH